MSARRYRGSLIGPPHGGAMRRARPPPRPGTARLADAGGLRSSVVQQSHNHGISGRNRFPRAGAARIRSTSPSMGTSRWRPSSTPRQAGPVASARRHGHCNPPATGARDGRGQSVGSSRQAAKEKGRYIGTAPHRPPFHSLPGVRAGATNVSVPGAVAFFVNQPPRPAAVPDLFGGEWAISIPATMAACT